MANNFALDFLVVKRKHAFLQALVEYLRVHNAFSTWQSILLHKWLRFNSYSSFLVFIKHQQPKCSLGN